MNVGKTLFAQLMAFVPWTSFSCILKRYGGDTRVGSFNCAEQFRVMALAQLTCSDSLTDIKTVLGANAGMLYAVGLRSAVRRSTLADANESRDWRIWSNVAALVVPPGAKALCKRAAWPGSEQYRLLLAAESHDATNASLNSPEIA